MNDVTVSLNFTESRLFEKLIEWEKDLPFRNKLFITLIFSLIYGNSKKK